MNNDEKKVVINLTSKDSTKIGMAAGATIVGLVAGVSLIDSLGKLIKNKYYKWKFKKDYKKLYYRIMNDPRFTDEEKANLKEKVGPYIESK